MNFLKLIRELLLGLCISILIPITTYWGVSSFYSNPSYPTYEHGQDEATKSQVMAEWKESRRVFDFYLFYAALLVGLLLIIAGMRVGKTSLAIGLTTGGFFNICMSLFFNPNKALGNFLIYFALLLIVIAFIVKGKE